MKFVWGTGLLHPNPSPALTPFMTLVSRKTSVPSDGPLATLGSCYLSELACWPYSVSCSYCRSQPWGQAHRPAAELDRSIKGFAVSKFMFITLALRQRVLFENDGRRKKTPNLHPPLCPPKEWWFTYHLSVDGKFHQNSLSLSSGDALWGQEGASWMNCRRAPVSCL